MTSYKQIEIQFEDPNPQKWRHALKEDVFAALMSKENTTLHKIFGEGSLFSPFLFGKFFDPSDAFPLWEFDSEVLLLNPNSSSCQRTVDWFQTDTDYVMKAELPAVNGKILEITGVRRQEITKDWKSSHWWEQGYVRRLELPEQTADWIKSEARVGNNKLLEIKIPKIPPDFDNMSHTT